MQSVQSVANFLNTRKWVLVDDPAEQIAPLGSRWNNENFVITAHELYGETRYFLRLGRGGGLGLMARIAYEFGVLQVLGRSGITPRPFYCDEAATMDGVLTGALLMEYLPGQPFVCAEHWRLAAQALAVVHAQHVKARLIVRHDPVMDVYGMCAVSGGEGSDHLDELHYLAARARRLLGDEERVVVHGSVRPTDFVVDEDGTRAWLVDWENGGVSSRWADLGLFMASAAAATDGAYCRDDAERRDFLDVYAMAAGVAMPMDDMLLRAAIFERACALRLAAGKPDVSWCPAGR
jgi:aminoglycoside phosphotransferase (APT) family kinase protein